MEKNNIYDYSKLKGKIIEKYGSMKKFIEKIKISQTSFYKKINNKVEFKQSEIMKICDLLCIPVEESKPYFFTIKVKKNATKEN